MQASSLPPHASAKPRTGISPAPLRQHWQHAEQVFRSLERERLLTVIHSYRRFGGLAEAADLDEEIRARWGATSSRLARWIAGGEIVTIRAHGALLIPRFQITSDLGDVHQGVRDALRELADVFDGWELARWFVHPNCWLEERWPLDLVVSHPQAVIEAARGDRYIARG